MVGSHIGLYKHEYPPAADIDWAKHFGSSEHGTDDHYGFRCPECAALSKVPIQLIDRHVDYWQNVQISWQEDCDKIMAKFDEAVADHFREHTGPQCQTCPEKSVLPPKPLPVFERRWSDE